MQQEASSFWGHRPQPLTRGSAPDPPGAQPSDPQHLPQCFLFPKGPNLGCLDKTLLIRYTRQPIQSDPQIVSYSLVAIAFPTRGMKCKV